MFVAYSEKLVRTETFLLLCIVGHLNGFRGGGGIRVDAIRLLELTLDIFGTQPLVLRDEPPAQDGEDGSGAKYDDSLWIPQS